MPRHGLTLPEALDFVRKSAPAAARVLVRVGHDSGALPEALRDAAASRSASPPGWQTFGARVAYLCLVLAVMQAIVGFILYFIIPKFEAIFKDFGVDLPRLTSWMIARATWLTERLHAPGLHARSSGSSCSTCPFAFAGYARAEACRSSTGSSSAATGPDPPRPGDGRRGGPADRAGPRDAGRSGIRPTWVRERLAGVDLDAEQGHDWIEALRRSA